MRRFGARSDGLHTPYQTPVPGSGETGPPLARLRGDGAGLVPSRAPSIFLRPTMIPVSTRVIPFTRPHAPAESTPTETRSQKAARLRPRVAERDGVAQIAELTGLGERAIRRFVADECVPLPGALDAYEELLPGELEPVPCLGRASLPRARPEETAWPVLMLARP